MKKLVNACPSCGSSDVRVLNPNGRCSTSDHRYRCRGCGSRFDRLETRVAERSAPETPTNSLAWRLHEMGRDGDVEDSS